MKVLASNLKTGDVIMPPSREVSLWMRRSLKEKGLPESALYLTVVSVTEAMPDKNGRWLRVECSQTAEWTKDQTRTLPFVFKARPETPWPTIKQA